MVIAEISGLKVWDQKIEGAKIPGSSRVPLKEIIDASWKVGEDRPVKAYSLEILSGEEEILLMKKGNFTRDSRGSSQNFFKGGESIDIFFEVYY